MRTIRFVVMQLWVVAAASAALAQGQSGQLDALHAMLGRTSIRGFDPARPVTDQELQTIMSAGYGTRTLDGSAPFEFVQIRDPKTLKGISQAGKFAEWIAAAPAAVAVLVRTSESPRCYAENGALAVMAMSYQAQELGLGTCFLGTRDNRKLKALLGVGDNRHLLTVLPFGAPPGRLERFKRDWDKAKKTYPLAWTVSQGTYGGALSSELAARLENDRAPARQAARSGTAMSTLLDGKVSQVERFLAHDGAASLAGAGSSTAERAHLDDALANALEAMRQAPSSKFQQPQRWVLVNDPQEKRAVAQAVGDQALADAAVVAVLAGSRDSRPFVNPKHWARQNRSPHFIPHGAMMSLFNFEAGLAAQGLGVRVTAVDRHADSRLRVLLANPGERISKKRVHFLAAIGVGTAAETTQRARPGLPANRVHRERFGIH